MISDLNSFFQEKYQRNFSNIIRGKLRILYTDIMLMNEWMISDLKLSCGEYKSR